MKKIIFLLISLGFSMILISPTVVHAGDLLDTLYENGTLSYKQYQELIEQRQLQKDRALKQKSSLNTATKQNVNVNTSGGLVGRSTDGAFTFQLHGRLLLDSAFYKDGAFDDDGDIVEPGNGSEVRRAFLTLDGRVWNDWEYELEMDFGENEPELVDAFIRYIGGESWDFRLGHIKEPFSLEEQTSNLNITFMERSLPNVFAPDRNFGYEIQSYGDNWSLTTGIFGEGADDSKEQDEGFAMTARGTYIPILEENSLVHFGASITYRQSNDDTELRIRARPESHISDVRYANTGKMKDIEDYNTYGVEFALSLGSFSLQSEYIATNLTRSDNATDLAFDGFYIFASWIMTGESRSYRDRKGEFGHITPDSIVGKGGTGAWELALRHSQLDLNDQDINGGEQTNLTLGLNWYATPNIRFMFNLIHVESEQLDGTENEDADILQMRAQLAF